MSDTPTPPPEPETPPTEPAPAESAPASGETWQEQRHEMSYGNDYDNDKDVVAPTDGA